jgi:transposase-like protein
MAEPTQVPPSSEVVPKAKRRTFTAEYKRRVLTEADGCKADPGAIGALLRREGLYSSHLTTWRRERERAELEALAPRRRGPKPREQDERDVELARLRKDVAAWQERAERAELLCDIQKKVAGLLGIPLARLPEGER